MKKRGTPRKKPVTRARIEELLRRDPSGRELADLLVATGRAARVERADDYEPLPSLG